MSTAMNTKDIVHIALFAALTAALGVFPPVTLPVIGVPITAQSMGAMLAGSILGARRGALALVLFLVLVAAGLPLLAGGRGGFAVFLGPSAGFLFAWPLTAFVTGWLFERYWARLTFLHAVSFLAFAGIVVLYPIGILWIAAVAGAPLATVAASSAAFIPGDVVKIVLTAVVALAVKRSYPLIPGIRGRELAGTP
ncbi:biotin transporter BioY [Arenibaculum sp.]|jgi:biotin transport system substrate-specific component|uniref:biotin transporter BioY n=1 Tax=Arenibaculum sp. TaxID=2865862 RepID=UPI002E163070|nr:biotin transporter BioY [Arenibaculum sp.]